MPARSSREAGGRRAARGHHHLVHEVGGSGPGRPAGRSGVGGQAGAHHVAATFVEQRQKVFAGAGDDDLDGEIVPASEPPQQFEIETRLAALVDEVAGRIVAGDHADHSTSADQVQVSFDHGVGQKGLAAVVVTALDGLLAGGKNGGDHEQAET